MTLRPRSKKRQVQERLYHKLRIQFLLDNPICERCGGISTDVHHRKSRVGELLNKVEFFMAVCRECHLYIEDHSTESYEKGWKILRSA